jgi:hypothetical protein
MKLYIICLIILSILCNMYHSGGVYKNKIEHCNPNQTEFCGIKEFSYNFPAYIKKDLQSCINNNSIQKRVNIPMWKSGKTIPTSILVNNYPNIISWYKDFATNISQIVNTDVDITPLNFETSCCILIYDQKDDFINWHFDVNYFNGRFFTVLIPITLEKTCTKYIYKNYKEDDVQLDLVDDKCIVFEGEKVFHMASKLCEGEKRAILSLQYSTNSDINLINKFFMRFKDTAYIGGA